MTVINWHTHFQLLFSSPVPTKKYLDSFESIVVCFVCASWHADPSHRLFSIPSHFTTKYKKPVVGHSLLGKKRKNKSLSGKVLSIKAVETNGYRLEPPTPFFPSLLLNTHNVTLIGSQQSADNQQHDFDDRLFFSLVFLCLTLFIR